jgi:hypothetical protein
MEDTFMIDSDFFTPDGTFKAYGVEEIEAYFYSEPNMLGFEYGLHAVERQEVSPNSEMLGEDWQEALGTLELDYPISQLSPEEHGEVFWEGRHPADNLASELLANGKIVDAVRNPDTGSIRFLAGAEGIDMSVVEGYVDYRLGRMRQQSAKSPEAVVNAAKRAVEYESYQSDGAGRSKAL